MPEFILDTSGEVDHVMVDGCVETGLAFRWRDLDSFTSGYIEALFFTDNAPGVTTEEWQAPDFEPSEGSIPEDVGFSDLAPETLARIIKDCAEFQESEAWLKMREGLGDDNDAPETPDDEQAGRDFWYTRNGHGCGYWDGDWPEPYATELTAAAKQFRSVDSYLGDDGLVYLA
jgi:hypothetical protein